MKLMSVARVGEQAPRDEEELRLRKELQEARITLLRARAEKLKAEAGLLEDLGAYVKETASEAEAKAKVALAHKDVVEQLVERHSSLILEHITTTMQREIARDKQQTDRMKSGQPPRHFGRGGQRRDNRGGEGGPGVQNPKDSPRNSES